LKSNHVHYLVAFLLLVGFGLFAYKFFYLKFPLMPEAEVSVWTVEAEVEFTAQGGPAKFTLYLPGAQPDYKVMSECFVSGKYGRVTRGGPRRSEWALQEAKGKQTLFYRVVVGKRGAAGAEEPQVEGKAKKVEYSGIYKIAADALLEDVKAKSADSESLVTELLKRLEGSARRDENVGVFMKPGSSVTAKAATAVNLLRYAGMPARVVSGIALANFKRDVPVFTWIEVFHDGKWNSYNPLTGEVDIANDYLILSQSNNGLYKLIGGKSLVIQVSVSKNQAPALEAVFAQKGASNHLLFDFSALSLPIRAQSVYRLILMVPIVVLILTVFRNFVGVRTYGTFMPALIALAMLNTGLFWGVFLLLWLVALGMGARLYLAKLRLLMVPRIGSLLIIVVILMFLTSVSCNLMGLSGGLNIAFFPMIIITMTIERMSVVWEERGGFESLLQGAGSLVVAVCAYPLITNEFVENLFFVFPELLLPLLAGTVAMGRYSGYRLTELFRFKSLLGG